MRASLLAAALCLSAAPSAALAQAQAQARASERATLAQTVGGATVTIDYSRPSLRGRDSIFGTQVHWGAVWTPGANNATTLATTQPIRLNGVDIAAGRYGLWMTVSRDDNWVLHLHPDTAKWHLPPPPAGEMIASIPVTRRTALATRETLSWDFEQVRAGAAQLQMWWGRVLLSFELTVAAMPATRIDEALARRYVGTYNEVSMRDTTRRRQVQVRYDEASRQLMISTSNDQFPEAVGARWGMMLVPRSEDIFVIAYTINDELAQMSPATQQVFVEFTVENGSAASYLRRNSEDRITSRGVRAP